MVLENIEIKSIVANWAVDIKNVCEKVEKVKQNNLQKKCSIKT